MQEWIRDSRWWERLVGECACYIDFMSAPLGVDAFGHPLLMNRQKGSLVGAEECDGDSDL